MFLRRPLASSSFLRHSSPRSQAKDPNERPKQSGTPHYWRERKPRSKQEKESEEPKKEILETMKLARSAFATFYEAQVIAACSAPDLTLAGLMAALGKLHQAATRSMARARNRSTSSATRRSVFKAARLTMSRAEICRIAACSGGPPIRSRTSAFHLRRSGARHL